MLRLPDGMRERIAEAAEKNNRSMNAEFIARLEASFAAPPPSQGAPICHVDSNGGMLIGRWQVHVPLADIKAIASKGLDAGFREGFFGVGERFHLTVTTDSPVKMGMSKEQAEEWLAIMIHETNAL